MASVDTVNASSSSSSSSSSSLPFNNTFSEDRNLYDVFLSFRGSDSRANFTEHLYFAMRQKGIRTFRDEELFERGRSVHSELVRAIEGSKFAVIVFSRNYASSTWCLAELAKIVDCMEKKKLIVLPIFHHVDPSDVGNQTGALADAFAKHEERFKDSIEDVKLWRLALRKAASMSGFVLGYGAPESQLIAEFIELLCNLSNHMPEDGSTNCDLPPRFDDSPDEADDANDDADEMVQDYVADLPLEVHVVPDDVADVPQEAHVVEDHVAYLPMIGLENESLSNLSNGEVQLVTNFVESLSNLSIQMLEDGSDNLYLPPRFDDSQDEADNDADEMVQDYVADLPLIGLENESLSNLSNGEVQLITNFVESFSNLSIQMLEDGSDNLDLPPRFDDSQDEADNDVDEMVQDYVADLPLEVHVVPDDVADVPQEVRVVEDRVANLPQEAHVVEDHVANLQQVCAICVPNARGMAFQCGHTTCVECGERLDRCPFCRKPIVGRLRFSLGDHAQRIVSNE